MPSSIDAPSASGQHRRELPEASVRGAVGARARERARVHAQHRGQQRRADGSVRRREHSSQRRRKSVNGAEPGVRQAQPAIEAGERQGLTIVGIDRLPARAAACARGSAAADCRIPSRASGSVAGLARIDRNGSITCDSASTPLEASTAGGRPASRSGSTIAARASISGLRRLAFTPCSGDASTAFFVTSEPVPAVVGMAMNGSERCAQRLSAADDLKVVERITAVRDQRRDRLRGVEGAAAAEADHEIAAGLARRRRRPRARCRPSAPPRRRSASSERRPPPAGSVTARMSVRSAGHQQGVPAQSRSRCRRARERAGPNTMRAGASSSNARSAAIALTSPASSGRDVDVARARARLRHQIGDGVAPARIVGGGLVGGRRVGRAVDLDQHEARRVLGRLHDVEARDARLAEAVLRVVDRRRAKRLDRVRLHAGVDMNHDERSGHGCYPFSLPA